MYQLQTIDPSQSRIEYHWIPEQIPNQGGCMLPAVIAANPSMQNQMFVPQSHIMFVPVIHWQSVTTVHFSFTTEVLVPSENSHGVTNGITDSPLRPVQGAGDAHEETRGVKSLIEGSRVPKIFKRGKISKSKSRKLKLARKVKKCLKYPNSRSEVAISSKTACQRILNAEGLP